MTSKRILGFLVMLLGLCLASTTALTEVTKPNEGSKPAVATRSVVPHAPDAATKAKPQRAIQPGTPVETCGECYRDEWTNNVRKCCATVDGVQRCRTESCPRPPDVLK